MACTATTGRQRAAGIRALAPLAMALAASACATPYNPFRVTPDELGRRVRTIALAPLRVHPDVAEPASARAKIEPLVASTLEEAGFQVVTSDVTEELWRAAATDVGGIFDPVTGEGDEERFEAVRAAVYRDLRSQHGVDAVLYLFVSTIGIYLPTARASFCGTTQRVYWPARPIGWFEFITMVRATCLNATLYDMDERELYGIRSGLEVIETYARQTRAERPLAERLLDPIRLQEAVEAVVGPLATAAAEQ